MASTENQWINGLLKDTKYEGKIDINKLGFSKLDTDKLFIEFGSVEYKTPYNNVLFIPYKLFKYNCSERAVS